MNTPMLDSWMAAFDKRTPSPLYSKPLVYTTGALTGPGIMAGEDKIAHLGPGWETHLKELYSEAAALSYRYAELDNPDAYNYGDVAEAMILAYSRGLGIIAKNPLLTKCSMAFISHPNVFGVIVERGAGTPSQYDDLRRRARQYAKLPVWFIFDGRDGSAECAAEIEAGGFKGMSVTYSASGRYADSTSVLLPVV
jgi:hypothetical protein